MKIYTKIKIDIDTGETILEESYEYTGSIAKCDWSSQDQDNVDEAHNARMANIAEEQQGWASKYANYWEHGVGYDPSESIEGFRLTNGNIVDMKKRQIFNPSTGQYEVTPIDQLTWGDYEGGMNREYGYFNVGQERGYDPNAQISHRELEQKQLAADYDLVPLEAEHRKLQLQGDTDYQNMWNKKVMENKVNAEKWSYKNQAVQAKNAFQLAPDQFKAKKLGIQNFTKEINERSPVVSEFYKQALNGINENAAADRSQADFVNGLKGQDQATRFSAARMGVDPTSGRFTTSSLDRAKGIGTARTQGRMTAKNTNFARLTTAKSAGLPSY